MRKNKEKPKILVKVEFTEGYQERFTKAVLKIYAKRIDGQEEQNGKQGREIYNSLLQHQQMQIS